ncbi:hypothetical protein [uncultured Fibrella sp.]|uniref:hypothetical protein n=1 Tax=uncultured Fibrella sp. TaxID=1284596 RepID=UPI0035CABF5C
MQKSVLNLCRLSLMLVALSQQPAQASIGYKPTPVVADDEYDRYRQKGDESFKVGRYDEARRQYRNCLEVPGFENDPYAKQRIELATQCLTLVQQADDALQQQKNDEVVARLTEVLALNPTDPLVKGRLADYYLSEGNQLFDQQRFSEAKVQYNKGLAFAQAEGNRVKQSTLELQIRNSDNRIKQIEDDKNKAIVRYVVPKRTGLKIAMGILAIGSGYYAYTLQNDFTTKQTAFNAVALAMDPDGDGIINTLDEYQRYATAYKSAEDAQSKRGLYTACVAVAAAATLTELYLLVHKPKPRQVIGFHIRPSQTGYGLAVGYRF